MGQNKTALQKFCVQLLGCSSKLGGLLFNGVLMLRYSYRRKVRRAD